MTSGPEITKLNDTISVSPQLGLDDVTALAKAGFKSIICNRPDEEEGDHPRSAAIAEASEKAGLGFAYIPAVSGSITDQDGAKMAAALASLPAPVLAYCRSGARSTKLTEMAQSQSRKTPSPASQYNVVVVGGGSAGIATAASMLKRNKKISLAIIEPSGDHYYQPGWTMVGGGAFSPEFTHRKEKHLIPERAQWIQSAVTAFDPDKNLLLTADGQEICYDVLIVCPGIKLNWGRDRRPARGLGEKWSHLQLPLRSRALHVRPGQAYDQRASAVHPAANADKMRGRTAKINVSLLQQMGESRRIERY